MIVRLLKEMISRQPFVFLRGILKGNLLLCSYFDVTARICGAGIKVMPGTRVFKDCVIHSNSYLGYGCFVAPSTKIMQYSSIGNFVIVGGGDHGVNSSYLSSRIFPEKFRDRNSQISTVIEPDAWIGNGSILKGGVRVGQSSIVGMGAVVVSSTNPYSINVGVPARQTSMRLDKELISEITSSRWWELEPGKVRELRNGRDPE